MSSLNSSRASSLKIGASEPVSMRSTIWFNWLIIPQIVGPGSTVNPGVEVANTGGGLLREELAPTDACGSCSWVTAGNPGGGCGKPGGLCLGSTTIDPWGTMPTPLATQVPEQAGVVQQDA